MPRQAQPSRRRHRPHLSQASGFAILLATAFAGLPAEALAQAQEQEAVQDPGVITADRLVLDDSDDVLTATGDVEITVDERRLLADRVRYDRRRDVLTAEGNVVLLEPTGEAFFGDRLEITGDLRDGVVSRLRALLDDQSRLAAKRGIRRDGRITILQDAVYSPCALCEEEGRAPLWQIRAREVVHDADANTVTYENATFELFGVPVAWAPYFSHPDPTVERKTGFLTPSFGTDSELGLTLEQPFFLNLAPNRDVTLTPLLTSRAGAVLGGEYRELREIGETSLGGSITYTEEYQSSGTREAPGDEVRGNVVGEGRYRMDEVNAGFDLDVASDNTYLDRYGFGSADVLQNRLFAQNVVGRDFWGVNGYAFQSLREDDEQGLIPIVLPLVESGLRSQRLRWGSMLTLDSSVLALTRTDGLDTRRLSSEVGWQIPWVDGLGGLWQARVSTRGDIYNYDGNPQTLQDEGGTQSEARIRPRATLDYSFPMVGGNGNWQHVVEPLTMLTVAPTNGNDDDIPNEDSRVFELDETNVFEPNRFTGIDLVDEGARLAYGVRVSSFGPRGLNVSGVLGQSYQPDRNSAFEAGSGASSNFSDIVGRLDFRPSPLLDVAYRFRLDQGAATLRRNDLSALFGPSWLRFSVGYLELTDDPVDLAPRERTELRAGVRAQIIDNLAIAGATRWDLEEEEPVSHLLGLLYSNSCLTIVAGFERSFTSRGELDDETSFKVRVSLTNLGSASSGSDIEG